MLNIRVQIYMLVVVSYVLAVMVWWQQTNVKRCIQYV